ncbi:MAG: response regulator [Myxococcales bacterium]|nr:response regulator [Myxococcales bacterium]
MRRLGGGAALAMALQRVQGGVVNADHGLAGIGWEALLVAPVALGAYLDDGTFLLANDAAFDLIGYTPAQVVERGWIELLHPDPEEQAATRRVISELIRAGAKGRRHQQKILRGDGSERLLDLTSSSFALPDGQRGVVTTLVDATEEWMPIGATRGHGFRELVDDAPDILSRVDVRTGRFLFISRAIERVSGFSPEEIYRDPDLVRSKVQPEYQARWEEALRKVARGAAETTVVGMFHKDGRPFLLQQSLHPVRDATGRVVVIEGLARDITAVHAIEKQLEKTIDELKARNAELASLDRLKSQLLANVSHELRTPLVSIKGYNELILGGSLGPLTPRQRRGLEIARSNTDRLVELIETLLDFARREEGRLALHQTRLDLRAAVRDGIAPLAARIAERGIELVVDLGNDPLEVDGDRGRLAQLVKVLVTNAEKFCEGPGTIRLLARRQPNTLWVWAPTPSPDQPIRPPLPSLRSAEAHVVLEVRDTGIGIPEAAREKIFDPFFQVDSSSTRRFGGAGLGLALAREIISLHGGDIAVESSEGAGSTFTVRLPAASIDLPEARGEQPVLLVAASGSAWPLLKERLELEGFALLHAETPAEVVRRARRHRPDAVVLASPAEEDPALGEALDELRRDQDTQSIPVVAMATGEQRAALRSRADHVVEPHDVAGLAGAIRRLLAGGPPKVARPGTQRPRVVIADDDAENLDFTRFLLEREGYEVVCVATGEAALVRVGEGADLVILDVAMTGLDGLEACRRLKAQPGTARVPVVMITAMTGEAIRKRSFDAGADGFLLKPFSVAEFVRQVRLHVGAPGE